MQYSLGPIVCITPGIPVRATCNQSDPDAQFLVHGYSVQRLKSCIGNVYVSLSPTDDRATKGKLLAVLDSSTPGFSASITMEMNGINMASVYLDFDEPGDTAIIAVLRQ